MAYDEQATASEPMTPERIERWRQRIRVSTLGNYRYEMGVALIREGSLPEAEASLRAALAIDTEDARAAMALADLLESQGRGDEAAALIARETDRDPFFAQRRALRRLDAEAPEDAVTALAAWRADPYAASPDMHLRIELTRLLVDEGAWLQEETIVKPAPGALLQPAEAARFSSSVGFRLFQEMRFKAAENAFDISLRLDDQQVLPLIAMAHLAMGRGDWQRGLAVAMQAEKLWADGPAADMHLLALIGAQRLQEAESLLSSGRRNGTQDEGTNPVPASLAARRGLLLARAGEWQAAAAVLAPLYEADPDDLALCLDGALAQYGLGHVADGDKILADMLLMDEPLAIRLLMRRSWAAPALLHGFERIGHPLPERAKVFFWAKRADLDGYGG
jgi:tetratricopeptide (TPR) repeat protein